MSATKSTRNQSVGGAWLPVACAAKERKIMSLHRRSNRARQGQLGSNQRPLEQNLAPETDQLGRAATGVGRDLSGLLDETLLIDQAAKILLVQTPPRKRFDSSLE